MRCEGPLIDMGCFHILTVIFNTPGDLPAHKELLYSMGLCAPMSEV